MTCKELLEHASKKLEAAGVLQAKEEAAFLLAHILKKPAADIRGGLVVEVSSEQEALFWRYIEKREQRVPFAYITEEVEFLGCTLKVDPRVLVPRQETEILAESVIGQVQKGDGQSKKLWDICTGSGCLGISIAKHCPGLSVTMSDLCEKALSLAKENAVKNAVQANFLHGDLFQPFPAGEYADYIVCNPPYLSEKEYAHVEQEVTYEPKQALLSGASGVEHYQKLFEQLYSRLRPGGMAWLEMGASQAEELKKILAHYPWKKVEVILDWAGLDRFFFLEKE